MSGGELLNALSMKHLRLEDVNLGACEFNRLLKRPINTPNNQETLQLINSINSPTKALNKLANSINSITKN